MEEIDAEKLYGYLRELPNKEVARAYTNLFALGCYLRLQGHHDAGTRACRSVLRAMGYDGRKTYFDKLMKALPGNEAAFARELSPSLEINKLFHDLPPRPSESE